MLMFCRTSCNESGNDIPATLATKSYAVALVAILIWILILTHYTDRWVLSGNTNHDDTINMYTEKVFVLDYI